MFILTLLIAIILQAGIAFCVFFFRVEADPGSH